MRGITWIRGVNKADLKSVSDARNYLDPGGLTVSHIKKADIKSVSDARNYLDPGG